MNRGQVVYRTAVSLDGFIADQDNSLGWLFAAEHSDSQAAEHAGGSRRTGRGAR